MGNEKEINRIYERVFRSLKKDDLEVIRRKLQKKPGVFSRFGLSLELGHPYFFSDNIEHLIEIGEVKEDHIFMRSGLPRFALSLTEPLED